MELRDLYRSMYLIRASEKKIQKHYHENEMKTPMHMSSGSEAISVGVCAALDKNDIVYGTFRSHALYVAKTQELDLFFGELFGRTTGMVGGKAGSMHLIHPELGHFGSVAIVAAAIPVAVGSALASKYKNTRQVVAVFFGDGAVDEGSFWESINCACLWELPILFICEDNGLAVHTYKKQRQGYDNLVEILKHFRCDCYDVGSTDVEEIFNRSTEIINNVRFTKPAFMRFHYYRYLEHVGVNEDFVAGYRPNEMATWLLQDPLLLARNKLLTLYERMDIEAWERQWDSWVTASFDKARQANSPDSTYLLECVLCRE